MPRSLDQQVIVLTGASSGIGRETARQLGTKGATLVLAARNPEGLEETASLVREAGGKSSAVITDVSDWEQVNRLAQEARGLFGTVDTWINNAGIALYSEVEEATPDEMKRVIDVNLMGTIYGCMAAIKLMRDEGEGTIINLSSVLARRSVPMQSAYCAAKHGVTGFTEAFRLELERSHPGIRLVEIMPSSINTPLFSHARSRMGVHPMPIPPIYDPSVVAGVMVHACEHGGREYVAGGAGKIFEVGERLSPSAIDAYLRQGERGVRQQQTDSPDDGRDNLFSPSEGRGDTRGPWTDEAKGSSTYTRLLELHPERKMALGLLAVAGTALALTRARR